MKTEKAGWIIRTERLTTLYNRVEIDQLREGVDSMSRKFSYIETCRKVINDAKSLKKMVATP